VITKSRIRDSNARHEVASISGDDNVEGVTMDMCWLVCMLLYATSFKDTDEALDITMTFNMNVKVQIVDDEHIFVV